ncbi:MAG: hypothetical protein ACLQVD_19765 [Capsulimonadaceae bacterium]
MDITERYTTKAGRQYDIRLTYNERIAETDPATAFVTNVEVLDRATRQTVDLPTVSTRFSTYEQYASFGGYTAINYFGVRESAIESLRQKVLTRIEDHLERLG